MATRKQPNWKDPETIVVMGLDPHGVEIICARLNDKFEAAARVVKDAHQAGMFMVSEQEFLDGLSKAMGAAPFAVEFALRANGKSATPINIATMAAEFEATLGDRVKAYVDDAITDESIYIEDQQELARFCSLLQQALVVK